MYTTYNKKQNCFTKQFTRHNIYQYWQRLEIVSKMAEVIATMLVEGFYTDKKSEVVSKMAEVKEAKSLQLCE